MQLEGGDCGCQGGVDGAWCLGVLGRWRLQDWGGSGGWQELGEDFGVGFGVVGSHYCGSMSSVLRELDWTCRLTGDIGYRCTVREEGCRHVLVFLSVINTKMKRVIDVLHRSSAQLLPVVD